MDPNVPSFNFEKNRCECKACGETFAIIFPVSANMFISVLKEFGQAHLKCEVASAERN
jgi:hypothetical protein